MKLNYFNLNQLDNNLIILICIFFIGLLIGSFLNVLIYKIPRKINIFKPYSICFNCRKPQSLLFSFPILSFLFKKNKCDNCNNKIFTQNFLIEILNALIYVLIYLIFGFNVKTFTGLILTSILLVISFIDLEFMIIPNIIILPFTIVGLIINIAININSWWLPFVFSISGFIFMFIVHLIYPKGMGMGDVKLTLMLGAFLVKDIIFALFAGFILGAIAGIILIIIKRKTVKQFIPFGPFLSAGAMMAFFIGDIVAKWYLKTL